MEPPLSRFFRLARKEALKSKEKYKMGCAITKAGKVIGKGHNKNKHNRLWGSGYSKMIHAESAAVIDAFGRVHSLIGCKAYVYRKGGLKSCPCNMCYSMLKGLGIKQIYFLNNLSEVEYI